MPIGKVRQSAGARLVRLLWQQPLWAVPFALFFGTIYGATATSYRQSYALSVVFAYTVGLGMWATRFFVVPRLPRKPGAKDPTAFWIATAYAASGMLASYVAALLIQFTFGPGFLGGLRGIVTIGLYSALFIALFSGIRFAMAYHDLALERARAVEQTRAELAQAELRALRAQINPHFLFNTLNSIASLIISNPRAAEDVTTQLADLFRYTLRASERETSTLGAELEFLRAYLAIERVRFGDRLQLEEAIEPGLEALLVPSLLLQPVVENAVRYAVAPRAEGGRVRMAARRNGDHLVLEVTDDGPGLDAARPVSGTGFGLHALRERLRAAGYKDSLEIDTGPGKGTCVRVTLPLASERKES
jgi:signal transduction histidine kinase